MVIRSLRWVGGVDGSLEILDQRRLPGEYINLRCIEVSQVYEALKNLAVRGAPAIGVAGAYGLVLSMQKLSIGVDLKKAVSVLSESSDYLASSRPTAVNLFWALNRVKKAAEEFVLSNPGADILLLRERVFAEASVICREDIDMCRRIGENGERFIVEGAGILTHCNAGALATAGQGTALSLMFEAHRGGKRFKVYVDETRPLLQGSRLSAWELKQAGIDVTVICDSAAGWLMKQGRIDAVVTGADRIAANGDVANKIGTYGLSVLARDNGTPFYVAAPSSTFDLSIRSGGEIPIEQRGSDEVAMIANIRVAPEGVGVYNPAFDVTDARDITAIITEKGVIERPDTEKVCNHLKG